MQTRKIQAVHETVLSIFAGMLQRHATITSPADALQVWP
jgi:hypothetical protein